jgi:hypothetical protein
MLLLECEHEWRTLSIGKAARQEKSIHKGELHAECGDGKMFSAWRKRKKVLLEEGRVLESRENRGMKRVENVLLIYHWRICGGW